MICCEVEQVPPSIKVDPPPREAEEDARRTKERMQSYGTSPVMARRAVSKEVSGRGFAPPDSSEGRRKPTCTAVKSGADVAAELYFLNSVQSGEWAKAGEVAKILGFRVTDSEVARAGAKAADCIALDVRGLEEFVAQGGLSALVEAWRLIRNEPAVGIYMHNVAARFLDRVGEGQLSLAYPETLAAMKSLLNVGKTEWITEAHRVAVRLHGQKRSASAAECYKAVIEALEASIGQAGQVTLQARNNLAVLLEELGRLDEAGAMHQENCDRLEQKLGASHPDTLSAKFNFAALKAQAGNLQEAEALYRQVVEERERTIGPRSADTLRAQSNLASLMRQMGRLREAESILRTLVDINHVLAGRDDSETLRSKSLLALVLMQQGSSEQLRQAEAHLREVVACREQKFGRGHADTLVAMSRMAFVLEERRPEEAEQLREQVAQCLDASAPQELRRTHARQTGYVLNLQETGETSRAEAMLRQVGERRSTQLGAAHPDSLAARSELAALLNRRGDSVGTEEALAIQREVAETYEATLGSEHVDTLVSMMAFLGSLLRQAARQEAGASPEGGKEVNGDVPGEIAAELRAEAQKLHAAMCGRFPTVAKRGASGGSVANGMPSTGMVGAAIPAADDSGIEGSSKLAVLFRD